MNKHELLDEMQRGYSTIDALLVPLDEEQMTTPGVNGEWSVKDMLAHLTSWHRYALVILRGAQQDEKPVFPFDTNQSDEQVNALFYEENKTKPLDEVRSGFRTTFLQIVEAVQSLSEETLVDPQRFAWRNGRALYLSALSNTAGHYRDHIGALQDWLAKSISAAQ